MKNIKYVFLFFCLLFENVNGQVTLYGIKNTAQIYEFVSIDCSNDSVTELCHLPLNFYTSDFSSCFDYSSKNYFYCTGKIIYKINIMNGNITDTFDFSSIHPSFLDHIVFNYKDGFIYGIKNNIATFAQFLTRFDPVTGLLTDIAPLTQGVNIGIGCKGAIDQLNQEYIIQSTSLTAIDIASGNIIYNNPILNLTNETLDHIAFSCKKQKVFGLSNNPHVPEEFLAMLDTNNAGVSHVDSLPLPVSYYKQYLGGSTIDNTTDIYYYAATGGIIYGIDINSGNVAYSHTFGPGFEFLFLESASDYHCEIEAINNRDYTNSINIFPNPAHNYLCINTTNKELNKTIIIFNSIGQKQTISISSLNNTGYVEINISQLSPGIYFLEMLSDKQKVDMGFIKE